MSWCIYCTRSIARSSVRMKMMLGCCALASFVAGVAGNVDCGALNCARPLLRAQSLGSVHCMLQQSAVQLPASALWLSSHGHSDCRMGATQARHHSGTRTGSARHKTGIDAGGFDCSQADCACTACVKIEIE